MNNDLKFLGGFLLGVAAGSLAGILFAPDSGHKTRRKIVHTIHDWEEDLERAAGQELDKAKKIIKDKLQEYTEQGEKALNNLRKKVPEPEEGK